MPVTPESAPPASLSSIVPPPHRPFLRRFWPVLVAVVVVVVVLAYFALAGIGSSGGSAGVSFATANGMANKSASGVPGGPWGLVTAIGYAPRVASQTNSSSSIGSGCTVSPPGSGSIPTTVSIPSFSGSFSSGNALWWGLFYYQPSTQQVLVVEVTNGAATPLLIASGSCVSTFQDLSPIPAGVVDSSTAASAAWVQGGSAFASVHSNLTLNLEMAILGGGTFEGTTIGPSWLVEVSPCLPLGLGGPSGEQPTFEAVVNATSGTLASPVVTSTTC